MDVKTVDHAGLLSNWLDSPLAKLSDSGWIGRALPRPITVDQSATTPVEPRMVSLSIRNRMLKVPGWCRHHGVPARCHPCASEVPPMQARCQRGATHESSSRGLGSESPQQTGTPARRDCCVRDLAGVRERRQSSRPRQLGNEVARKSSIVPARSIPPLRRSVNTPFERTRSWRMIREDRPRLFSREDEAIPANARESRPRAGDSPGQGCRYEHVVPWGWSPSDRCPEVSWLDRRNPDPTQAMSRGSALKTLDDPVPWL